MKNRRIIKYNILMGLTLSLLLIIFYSPAFGASDSVKEDKSADFSVDQAWNLANQFYRDNKIDEAIKEYTKCVDAGIHNPALFYNLGNAYFRAGEIARAIVNFERAIKLAPRDRDIIHNLDFARLQTRDKIKPPEYGFLENIGLKVFNYFSLNEWTLIVSVLYFLFMAAIFLALLTRRKNITKLFRSITYVLVVLFFITVPFFAFKLYFSFNAAYAIILDSELDIRSGPGDDLTPVFTLHAGTKVRVWETRNDWAQISLPNGLSGWLPLKSIEII